MGRPPKIKEENIEEASLPIEPEATASSIVEEAPKPKKEKPKTQKQICKVLYKTETKFSIDFQSDGIMIHDKSANKTDNIEVTYLGEYPKSFEIVSYKFI